MVNSVYMTISAPENLDTSPHRMELISEEAQSAKSPLSLEGWLEFNRLKWGVTPTKISYQKKGKERPTIEAILYLDHRGRVLLPPRNPYGVAELKPTDTKSTIGLEKQWISTATAFAEDMLRRGLSSPFILPPGMKDVRPWQWAGFKTDIRYTYHLDFPFALKQADGRVRNKIRKALKLGYRCQRTTNAKHILACMQSTEKRQGFRHLLTLRDIEMLFSLLGNQARGYVCYDREGNPVSSDITLSIKGGSAIGWVGGTCTDHLPFGVTQLLLHFIIEDLQQCGVTSLDFAGANLPTIATSKMVWGGKLTPYYVIEPTTTSYVVKEHLRKLFSFYHRIRF